MLPARFRSKLHGIASDRKSGAIELAVAVTEAFEQLPLSHSHPEDREIAAAVKFISNVQPSMVPIRNAAETCARITAGGVDVPARLASFRAFLETSREKVADYSQRLFHENMTVLTLSRSSTVMAALMGAAKGGRIRKVCVMESRPRFEGRITAKAISEMGVECALIADALGPSIVKKVDMVVVGADAVLNDGGVVNKIGTFPLSLACRDAGKPLYVLTESIKLDRRFNCGTWPGAEERDEFELLPRPPRGLRALNLYFDLTPPESVGAVVHDGGVSRRKWAGAMGKVLWRQTAESA